VLEPEKRLAAATVTSNFAIPVTPKSAREYPARARSPKAGLKVAFGKAKGSGVGRSGALGSSTQFNGPDHSMVKKLAWLLRAGARPSGLYLRKDGFAKVDDIRLVRGFVGCSLEIVRDLVSSANDSDERFQLVEDGGVPFIRAIGQGGKEDIAALAALRAPPKLSAFADENSSDSDEVRRMIACKRSFNSVQFNAPHPTLQSTTSRKKISLRGRSSGGPPSWKRASPSDEARWGAPNRRPRP
jgi:hypothetical protein